MKRICVVPYWDALRGNQCFNLKGEGCDEAYALWHARAAKEGYDLNTDDICPPEEAHGVWLIDLPRKRSIFDRLIRSIGKSTKVVLQQLESPLVVPQSHVVSNQSRCDFVLTYENLPSADPRRYHYRIPNHLDLEESGIPFSERQCVVMVNSNKMEGWFASGRMGVRKFPGIGKFLSGWDVAPNRLLTPARGELYSWRRNFARAAEKIDRDVLDIYGAGWRGDIITWLPVARPKPYRCAGKGVLVDGNSVKEYAKKIPLMGNYRFGVAVENYRGTQGYISEKLLDVIRAGSVPIYLGEESIGEFVPPGAFIDAREFRTYEELLHFLVNCSEGAWQEMREEGQSFLTSQNAAFFGIEAFVETAMKILRKL